MTLTANPTRIRSVSNKLLRSTLITTMDSETNGNVFIDCA
jgi:hypothetical protein